MAPLDPAPRPAPAAPNRRLIVNADDFGRSSSINAAVVRAHKEGILTSASLMVNEPGFDEAVALARELPGLGVGLHLALACGHSTLTREQIPGLIDDHRQFSTSPVAAGWRYFNSNRLRDQLRLEIHAQFARFQATGLELDHVNGHLHLHLHPTVFGLLMRDHHRLGIRRLRLTRDPFRLNARIASGRWLYRVVHWFLYRLLSSRARPELVRQKIQHTSTVFGLLQNGAVDESYLARLLPALPPGDSELYSHPSLDEFRNEFEALISPRIRTLVEQCGIQLIRYQDLS